MPKDTLQAGHYYPCKQQQEEEEDFHEKPNDKMVHIDVLPNEILCKILFEHLDPLWRVVCRSVCQRWYNVLLPARADSLNPTTSSSPFAFQNSFAGEAARGGHLKVLQWARSQGCPWNEHTFSSAAAGGHLEVLQWLRSQGCPWDAWTCASAAREGHLEVLQWAKSQGCPWDEGTCDSAARGGHLGLLQWARSQGCPWDAWTCVKAARGGHLDVLQWAKSHGCEYDREVCDEVFRQLQRKQNRIHAPQTLAAIN